jgi:hypothetical protein
LERVPYRQYVREAKDMVERFPHWYTGEREPTSVKVDVEGLYGDREAVCRVDQQGVGEVASSYRSRSGRKRSWKHLLYPGINLRGYDPNYSLHFPGVNLRGAELDGTDLKGVMDGADLRNVSATWARWAVSLRFASCRDANFTNADLRGCDVDGADFTGADLTDAVLPTDLTGTNITREQFVTLLGAKPGEENVSYRMPEASRDDVLAHFGGDSDALMVAMWSGDLEVRDRKNNRMVIGEYDPADHYIPAWVSSNTGG